MNQTNKAWAIHKLESLLTEEDIRIKKAAIQGIEFLLMFVNKVDCIRVI
jgi:hypothetical protein